MCCGSSRDKVNESERHKMLLKKDPLLILRIPHGKESVKTLLSGKLRRIVSPGCLSPGQGPCNSCGVRQSPFYPWNQFYEFRTGTVYLHPADEMIGRGEEMKFAFIV